MCTFNEHIRRLFQNWLAVCWPCKLPIQFRYAPEAPISFYLFVFVRNTSKSLPLNRGRSPFDQHQESRLVAGPNFLSMRSVFILYLQSIRFDGKTVNRGDQPRDCDPWCWLKEALPRETRMLEDWVAFVSSYLAWQNRSVNSLCSTTSIPLNSKRLVRPASALIVSSTVFLPMPPKRLCCLQFTP